MGAEAGGQNPLEALMAGFAPRTGATAGGSPPTDPFAAMLANFANPQAGVGSGPLAGADLGSKQQPPGFPPGIGVQNPMMQAFAPPVPRTLLQKIMPILHMVSVLCLLAAFVVYFEQAVYAGVPDAMTQGVWERWASLAWSKSSAGGVQAVPLFYAFTTLQVLLHSIRIYFEPPPQPPSGMIGMAIMNLPQPLPNLITAGMKYFAMGGALMDDLSVLLLAVGFVVWGAGWAVR